MRRRSYGESGGFLAELAVCLPVLLLLIIGLVELGRVLNAYYRMSRVTYEAARFASALYGLEEGDRNGPIKNKVFARVRTLIGAYGLGEPMRTCSVERQRFVEDATDVVVVTSTFDTPTPLFRAMFGPSMKVQARSPYLYHQ